MFVGEATFFSNSQTALLFFQSKNSKNLHFTAQKLVVLWASPPSPLLRARTRTAVLYLFIPSIYL